MSLLTLAITVTALAIIVAFLLQPEVPISGKKLVLGTKGYDIKALSAPAADGFVLQVLSYILTRTPFGPAIRRKLLNDNGVDMVRELASQIHLPPLYFPMKRLSSAELHKREQEEKGAHVVPLQEVLKKGVPDHHNPLVEKERAFGGFHPRSIMEYAESYRSGKKKPSEVMRKALDHVLRWKEEGFPIFSSLIEEDVMKQAYAADERYAKQAPLSVLDGVPIAFKDSVDIIGHNTYNGYNPDPKFQDYWLSLNSTKDDVLVERFRSLGAVIFGLTIMVEGGVSPLGYNSHYQGPFNPYSWYRYSGGSSCGSAVAVATGIVPLAIGFDGGGSIRIPAALSGVHGLATTFGRIPFSKEYGSTMIKSGPLAATSEDVLIGMAAMAENNNSHFYSILYDGGVHGTPPFGVYDYNLKATKSLKGMKVGIYKEWFEDSSASVLSRCHEVLNYLREQGVEIIPIDIPHLQVMSLAHGTKLSSEMAQSWERIYYSVPESLELNTRVLLGLGLTSTAEEILAGEKLRAWASRYVENIFASHQLDAIVSPMVGIEVPILAESVRSLGESNTALVVATMRFAFLANYLGLPGYSVPVGHTIPSKLYEKESLNLSLPVGFQLMGQAWTEHKLMHLARHIEHGFRPATPLVTRPLYQFDPFA